MEHFCFELHYQCLIEMIVGVKDFSLIGTIFFFVIVLKLEFQVLCRPSKCLCRIGDAFSSAIVGAVLHASV